MAEARRIEPREVRRKLADESTEVELVCAYEDEEKCRSMLLAGAQTLAEFRRRLEEVPKDREIVFYCA
jgi:hypothetical protein